MTFQILFMHNQMWEYCPLEGAGVRTHKSPCISNDVRTAGFYFKLGDLARIFPLIAHLLLSPFPLWEQGLCWMKTSTKGSFQNGLENSRFIWCIVFSFPSYILKMLTFKHFIVSSFKAPFLLVVKYLQAKILH